MLQFFEAVCSFCKAWHTISKAFSQIEYCLLRLSESFAVGWPLVIDRFGQISCDNAVTVYNIKFRRGRAHKMADTGISTFHSEYKIKDFENDEGKPIY